MLVLVVPDVKKMFELSTNSRFNLMQFVISFWQGQCLNVTCMKLILCYLFNRMFPDCTVQVCRICSNQKLQTLSGNFFK